MIIRRKTTDEQSTQTYNQIIQEFCRLRAQLSLAIGPAQVTLEEEEIGADFESTDAKLRGFDIAINSATLDQASKATDSAKLIKRGDQTAVASRRFRRFPTAKSVDFPQFYAVAARWLRKSFALATSASQIFSCSGVKNFSSFSRPAVRFLAMY